MCKVSYQDYLYDQANRDETLINKDLDKIFSDLKNLFEKQGYMVDWSDLKNDLASTLNTLSMASPFSLEEKQILLETKDLHTRRLRLEEIIKLIFMTISKIKLCNKQFLRQKTLIGNFNHSLLIISLFPINFIKLSNLSFFKYFLILKKLCIASMLKKIMYFLI